MFKIFVMGYNGSEWIERCLGSIDSQTLPFEAYVIDDASTDNQGDLIQKFCMTRKDPEHKWSWAVRSENKGTCYNLWYGLKTLDIQAEDIVVIVDGDDWLAHDKVLERLAEEYMDPDVWLTYGSYEPYPENTGQFLAAPYPKDVIEAKSYRKANAYFNHLITFKGFLWHQMREEDFQYDSGEWFRNSYDQAMIYPMLEMATGHFSFIGDTLYIYNVNNPLSEWITKKDGAYEVGGPILQNRPIRASMLLHDGGLCLHWEDKIEEVLSIARPFNFKYFVETGTADGVTSAAAADVFETVYTVELDYDRYITISNRLQDQHPNMVFMQGDSEQKILQIINLLDQDEPAVWWLDAHSDLEITPPGVKGTPIREELHAILSRKTNDLILIDDARLFGKRDYPTIQEIKDLVLSYNPESLIKVEKDSIRIYQ